MVYFDRLLTREGLGEASAGDELREARGAAAGSAPSPGAAALRVEGEAPRKISELRPFVPTLSPIAEEDSRLTFEGFGENDVAALPLTESLTRAPRAEQTPPTISAAAPPGSRSGSSSAQGVQRFSQAGALSTPAAAPAAAAPLPDAPAQPAQAFAIPPVRSESPQALVPAESPAHSPLAREEPLPFLPARSLEEMLRAPREASPLVDSPRELPPAPRSLEGAQRRSESGAQQRPLELHPQIRWLEARSLHISPQGKAAQSRDADLESLEVATRHIVDERSPRSVERQRSSPTSSPEYRNETASRPAPQSTRAASSKVVTAESMSMIGPLRASFASPHLWTLRRR